MFIRKKMPGVRDRVGVRRRGTAIARAFLPNSFRLIFAQGRICHYTHWKGRDRESPPRREMTGSVANFLLMTLNCHLMMNRRVI